MHHWTENLAKHQIKIEQLLNLLSTQPEDVVFLAGSIVEGFSNKGSDLDVFVISKQPVYPADQTLADTFLGKEYMITGHPVLINVTVVLHADLIELVDSVNNSLAKKKVDFNELRQIEFYHRLIHALPIQNRTEFDQLVNQLNVHDFGYYCGLNRLKYSENRHEDAVGALDSGDTFTAFTAARISMEKAVEALLFLQGQTNPRDKWLFRKLFALYSDQEPWVQKFIALYIGQAPDLEEASLKRKTIEMIRLANELRGKFYTQAKQ